jgi:hypothetical protein
MKRMPERQPLERRRPTRSKVSRHSSFPPGVRPAVPTPTAYAHIPLSPSAFASSPHLRPADTIRPLGTWHPGGPDIQNQQRPRSPPRPFFQPSLPASKRPDIPLSRTESPNPTIDPSRQDAEAHQVVIGGPTVTQLKELVQLRDKDLSKRSTLKNGVQDIVYQWQYAEEAQENFMRACDALMALLPGLALDTALKQKLQETWTQMQDMSGHVKIREQGLGLSLQQLFEFETRLATKEKRVYQKLDTLFGHGAAISEDEEEYLPTENLGGMVAPSRASSATTCSMAHEYYNKVGEIQLQKEDLFNFDSEHRKQEYIRETQRQNGQPVEPSDDVFYQKFFEEKAAMVRTYMTIVEKMEETRDNCHRQGVEVDEPNLPGFLDHILREEQSLHDRLEARQDGKPDPAILLRNETAHSQLRLERWANITQVNRPVELPKHETWDTLSEQKAAHTLDWAEQQAESPLAFPQYSNFAPLTAVPDDDEVLKERGRPPQSRAAAVSQGERPSRRYSTPALPTFSSRTSLRNGTLGSVPQTSVVGFSDQTHWYGLGILATCQSKGAEPQAERSWM